MAAKQAGEKSVVLLASETIVTPGANVRPVRHGGAAPVARVTTATAIYRELHAAIVSMEMTPGTPLNEKVLTERFGVSRTPVREALIRLVEDGLVDVFPQSGTFVARIPVALIPCLLYTSDAADE